MTQNIYDFQVKTINGKELSLKEFQGKVMLITNVASKCGLTPQYEGLESLYKKYHEKGLMVLGFPANEFLGQEPGSNAEIQEFCTMNYGIQFPMFEKVVVKGDGQHPLFNYLTRVKPETQMKEGGQLMNRLKEKGLLTGKDNDIKWNFEKFLIDKEGNVVARFSPEIDPQDPLIIKALEQALEAR